jgi:hypothetical protein
LQPLAAELRQAINAFPEIGRLHRQQYPHLRRDLNHRPRLQKASAKATKAGPSPDKRILILDWSASQNSTTHPPPGPGAAGSGSSMKPPGVEGGDATKPPVAAPAATRSRSL